MPSAYPNRSLRAGTWIRRSKRSAVRWPGASGESRSTGIAVQSVVGAPHEPDVGSVIEIAIGPHPSSPFDHNRSQMRPSDVVSAFANETSSHPVQVRPVASPRR
jgi:hypothetical protein